MTLRNTAQSNEAEPWAVSRQGYEELTRSMRGGSSLLEFKARLVGLDPTAVHGLFDSANMLDVAPNGTAVIPVTGFLTRRSYWQGDRASYEWIGNQVNAALNDASVSRIVLNVDSPGGEVSGTEQLSAAIFDGRSAKPIVAYVQGQAASAAYWLASAAEQIFAGRTSMLGSIGVIWTFIDWSKYDADLGIQEIDIVSSQSPNKALDPTTKSGREQIQATVDQLAGVFVADVARNRSVSEDTVISDFGQGWVLIGDAAAEVGLADGIESFDNVVHGESEGGQPHGTSLANSEHGEADMDTVNVSDITADWMQANCPQIVVALRDGFIAQSAHDTALSELQAKSTTALETTIIASYDTERNRILGIQEAAQGMGLSKLVAELVADSSVTLEGAKARLFEAVSAKRRGGVDALGADEESLEAPDPDGDADAEAEQDASLLKDAANYASAVSH